MVSLEFVLNVFVKEKEEHKTPAQWREKTFEKFHPPSVLLKYSGHKLNIISEVSLRLTHGSRTVEVVVLVQEGAAGHRRTVQVGVCSSGRGGDKVS